MKEDNNFDENRDDLIPEEESVEKETRDEAEESLSEEQRKIVRLQGECQEISDKYLRLVAEFENYKKRTSKERIELINNAGEDVIKSILDVLDDADRAEKQLEKSDDIEALKHGVSLIFNKLKKALYAKGLKPMECRGEEFNPELHDAITEVPASSEEMVGKVVDDVQTGYFLNDKIIRHAKVVVGK